MVAIEVTPGAPPKGLLPTSAPSSPHGPGQTGGERPRGQPRQPQCKNSGTPPQAEQASFSSSPCFHAPPYPLPPGPTARTCFQAQGSTGLCWRPVSSLQHLPAISRWRRAKAKIRATGQAGHEVGGISKPQAAWGAAWLAGTHPVFEVRRLDGVCQGPAKALQAPPNPAACSRP